MRTRAVRTVQRLALAAGLCAGAWVAAEGLDHGTAWADDVPIRVEETVPAPGGGGSWGAPDSPGAGTTTPVRDLVDDILDQVLPAPAHDEETEPPAPPVTPVRDAVDEVVGGVVDIITPDPPQTPEPAAGDDGRPQHPVDAPPAPVPTPTDQSEPPPAEIDLIPGLPGTPEVAETDPLSTGGFVPATYWPVPTTRTDAGTGGPVCDSRDRPTPPLADGPDTRDRPASPRGLAGPGPLHDPAPCDPDGDGLLDEMPVAPASYSGDHVLVEPAAIARIWVLDLHRDALGHGGGDDELPLSRLTLWPPGPG